MAVHTPSRLLATGIGTAAVVFGLPGCLDVFLAAAPERPSVSLNDPVQATAPVPLGPVDKILYEFRDGPIRTMTALGAFYLEAKGLEQLYRSLAQPDLPSRHVFVIQAFQDLESQTWAAGPMQSRVESFASWHLHYIEAAKARSSSAARLVSTEEGTVVQTSDAGRVTTHVLEGQNPLSLSVENTHLEIVAIEFFRLPDPIPPTVDGTNPLLLNIWAKASHVITPVQASAMLRALQAKFDNPRILLRVRPDGWFVYDGPAVWLPFGGDNKPPTWEEFSHTRETYCVAQDSPQVRCRYANMPTSPDAPY
jgi:hypothetical protein